MRGGALPIRLGLLQPGRLRAARGRRPGQGRRGTAEARLPRRDWPRTAPHLRAQRPVGLDHAQRDRKGRVCLVLPAADIASPGPVPQQARPRPVPEPRGLAEPASVNHPSPADRGRNIGRWPMTPIQRSRVDNHRVPVRSRSLQDLPRSPSSHPASALVIGRRDRQGALRACLLASRRHPGYLHSSSTSLCTAPYTPDPTRAGVIGARLSCRLSPSGGIRCGRSANSLE